MLRTERAAADALSPLHAGYRELYEKVLAVANQDDRVRTMWLSGSVGRGVADAGSDLDVVLALAPASFEEFAAGWRNWLAEITPTVLARPLAGMPGSFFSVTTSCLRLDVVAERAGSADPDALALRLLVLDKDGIVSRAAAAPPKPVVPPPGPDPARLAEMVGEFFRHMTIFPAAVVARTDWLLGVVGVQGVQLMLYELFVEANQPLPPMGIKQWSARLTPEQRDICAGLPAPSATSQSVLAAMRTTAAAYRQAATTILAAHEVPWPMEFEQAVRRFWQDELGWMW